ncbi:MAG TPA: AsmA-like C-terminal region-containing protein, partial [Dissulfurispiraceae bacterium]|nr:AsmA-like C-terminal region-containing protein [Dissulfurispiraceae bacterium]
MKRALLYSAVVLGFVVIFLALRGPHVSNALSRLILPELADATGRTFAVERITLNLLPLFIEMRGVRAYDEKGDVTISASRVKGYLDLTPIFRKEVTVRRIAVRDFVLRSDRAQLDDLAAHLKKYLSEEKKGPVKVTVKSLDIRNAAVSVTGGDPQGSASGINGEVQLSPSFRCRLTAQSLKLQKSGMTDLESTVSAFFTVENNDVQIKELTVRSGDSFLKTSGTVDAKNFTGQLETELFLLVENAKDILRLERPGQGTISVKGTLKSDGTGSGVGTLTADLRVSVECYLETLMEFLKVKEKLQGHMRSEGTVTGRLDSLTAQGKAQLSRGNLFGVQIDTLHGSIDYRDGVMTFSEARASLFGGSAVAEASITLPVVDRYDLHVAFKDLNSDNVFQLIAWDPHLSKGVVSGEISSSGRSFNPTGTFFYRSREPGRDVIGKVKTVEGDFAMQDEVIAFSRMLLSTDRSSLNGAGTVDLKRTQLTFTVKGSSADIAELTGPYFTAVTGSVTFDGAVSGPLDDLEIAFNVKGRDVRMSAGNLHEPKVFNDADFALGDVDAAIRYRKNLFTAESLVARSGESEYRASGTVSFPKARNLFELGEPVYDLTISAKRGDLPGISGLFRDIPPVRGLLDVQVTMKGKPGGFTFRGDFAGASLAVSDNSIDRLEGSATFIRDTFHVKKVRLQKGDTSVMASGSLSLDKEFSLDAEVARVRLSDVIPNAGEKAISALSQVSLSGVKVKGEGTFDNPALRVSASVETNDTNGRSLGKGELHGSLTGRSLSLRAALLDGRLEARVESELRDPFPWRAEAEMRQGRYDPLITGFMKDVPEDLLLTIKGGLSASGDKKSFSASARIEKVAINLYGNAFTNRSPIVVRALDRSVVIEPVSFSSDITEFTVGGAINVGKRYDFSIEGSSSLAPLRAFS